MVKPFVDSIQQPMDNPGEELHEFSAEVKKRESPDAESFQLRRGLLRPIPVRGRTGRAWMENPADFRQSGAEDVPRALPGELADSDDPFRMEDFDNPPQVAITGVEKRLRLKGR